MKCEKSRSSGSIGIAGAGPGGAMLARLLQMRGFDAKVFERDASATARPQGGSLDLRADSGQRAVDAAGLTAAFAAVSREDAKAFRMLDAQGAEVPGAGAETHEDPGPEIDRADLRRLLPVLGVVRDAFGDWSPRVMDMLTDVQDGFHLWPTSVIPPDARWPTRSGLTMLGDAAHAMPPFTGKGVNLALLDALELADGLTADPGRDVAEAVGAFEAGMQARTSQESRACLAVGRQAYGIDLDFDTLIAT